MIREKTTPTKIVIDLPGSNGNNFITIYHLSRTTNGFHIASSVFTYTPTLEREKS